MPGEDPLSREVKPGFEKRATVAVNQTIEDILKLYAEGASRRRIHETIKEKYGLSWATIDTYCSRARKILVKSMEVQREEFVATQLSALEELADKSTQDKQYSAACGARNLLLKVTGSIPKDN